MAALRNEFAWSKKKARNFTECKRLYWFDAYGKWPGWEVSATPRTKEIYLLANLKTRWMWAGDIVHQEIAAILRSYRDGDGIDPAEALKGIRERMRQDFISSRKRTYEEPGRQKSCALREHHYGEEVAKDQWEKVVAGAESAVRCFLSSRVFAQLKEVPYEDWLAIDESTPASFLFEGLKVWLKVDAAHRLSDRRIRIIDWKTGVSEDEWAPLQLAVYALYANAVWGVQNDHVVVARCELGSMAPSSIEEVLDESILEAARKQIRDDAKEMERHLKSTREENIANEANFPPTDKPRNCQSCNFLKVCPVTPLK